MFLQHFTARPPGSQCKAAFVFVAVALACSLGAPALAHAQGVASAKSLPSAQAVAAVPVTDPDAQLVRIFSAIDRAKWDEAITLVDALIAAKPNYRLAYLIKGDLLQARARPLSTFGAGAIATDVKSAAKVKDLREEALVRLQAYRFKPPKDAVPRNLLMPRADQKHAVLVDTKRSRLYVYETGEGNPKLVADYYMTQGKNGSLKQKEGDQKTPLGVYQVISYLPKSKLADLYGAGAFPIDYPNEWDRRLGRTGHGIWLHGTPSDTFARPPLASDGCVVLTNEDLAHISRFIQPGVTPMVIAENVEWVSPDALAKEREGLRAAFEAWRGDWESLNMDRYLGHYHANFSGEGMGIAEWSSRKRAVNAGKAWIKVGVSNLSMFRYPGKDDLAVVTFDQDYKSSNLNSVAKKRQYWFHDGRKWHILDESTL